MQNLSLSRGLLWYTWQESEFFLWGFQAHLNRCAWAWRDIFARARAWYHCCGAKFGNCGAGFGTVKLSFFKRVGWPIGFRAFGIVKSTLKWVSWSPIPTTLSAKGCLAWIDETQVWSHAAWSCADCVKVDCPRVDYLKVKRQSCNNNWLRVDRCT